MFNLTYLKYTHHRISSILEMIYIDVKVFIIWLSNRIIWIELFTLHELHSICYPTIPKILKLFWKHYYCMWRTRQCFVDETHVSEHLPFCTCWQILDFHHLVGFILAKNWTWFRHPRNGDICHVWLDVQWPFTDTYSRQRKGQGWSMVKNVSWNI